MQLVAALGPLMDQVGLVQGSQVLSRLIKRDAGQCRRQVAVGNPARLQCQQSQQSTRPGRQSVVRQPDRGLDPVVEMEALAMFDQPLEVIGQRPAGSCLDPAAGQRERQWELADGIGDPCRGVRVGLDPALAGGATQQPQRVVGAEHVQGQVAGCRQVRQPVAARHDDQAVSGVRQQVPDLLLAGRVVEQDERTFAGQQLAVLRDPQRKVEAHGSGVADNPAGGAARRAPHPGPPRAGPDRDHEGGP